MSGRINITLLKMNHFTKIVPKLWTYKNLRNIKDDKPSHCL